MSDCKPTNLDILKSYEEDLAILKSLLTKHLYRAFYDDVSVEVSLDEYSYDIFICIKIRGDHSKDSIRNVMIPLFKRELFSKYSSFVVRVETMYFFDEVIQ